jgi:ketosteroid isomerase-like protein
MGDPTAKQMLVEALEAWAAEAKPLPLADWIGPLREFLAAVAIPDFECIMQPAPPTPAATSTGLDGFENSWNDFAAAFTDFHLRVEDVREVGDFVVANATQIARTNYGGVEITQPSAVLVAFEDSKVTRIEFHIDRDEALRRAGLVT